MRADVIVVGGGPVGLALAAELAEYGVRTVLFEMLTAVSRQPKATTVHARAVQCLVRRGRLPWLAPMYQDTDVTRPFRFAGLPGLTIIAPGTEPEPLLKIPQALLEEAFEGQALAAGARIVRGHRVLGLHQDAHGVRVTARGPDGTTVLCAAGYAVGADGARSTVRALAGIGSETWRATASSMMGLVTLPDPGALSPGWHRTARGWIVATPAPTSESGPDSGMSVRTLTFSPAADRTLPLTAPQLRREVEWIAGRRVPMENPRWLKRFSDFSRLARGYRAGRVLLVGDAAHGHFPIGGQGLSTGLLDAVNLGWKLAHAVHGTAAADLLDSYDAERRPAARSVIATARAQLELMRPDPEFGAIQAVLADCLPRSAVTARLGAVLSGQNAVMPARSRRPSAWEGQFLRNRRLTTTEGRTDIVALLRPGRFLLVLFGAHGQAHRAQAAPWARLLTIVQADPEPDTPCDALLVRPDGYLAWACDQEKLADALGAYLGPGHDLGADPAPSHAAAPVTHSPVAGAADARRRAAIS